MGFWWFEVHSCTSFQVCCTEGVVDGRPCNRVRLRSDPRAVRWTHRSGRLRRHLRFRVTQSLPRRQGETTRDFFLAFFFLLGFFSRRVAVRGFSHGAAGGYCLGQRREGDHQPIKKYLALGIAWRRWERKQLEIEIHHDYLAKIEVLQNEMNPFPHLWLLWACVAYGAARLCLLCLIV